MTTVSVPVDTGAIQAARKLGRDWRLLFTASTVSVLGDGVFLAALPLAASGMTHDPHLISGLTVAGTLPWLLFSLYSGAIADRSDGRRLLIRSEGAQLAVVAVFGAFAGLALGGIWAFYALAFALGLAAVMAKSASQTLLPSLVPSDQLITANARLFTAQSVAQQFLGPGLGAMLFITAPFLPFWVDAATFAVSMLLIARLPQGPAKPARPRRDLHVEVREGITWLLGNRLLRTTTMLVATANFANLMGYSTLVLYAGAHAYGILLSASAVGGIAGGLASQRIMSRFSGRRVVRVTLLTTPLSLLGIGFLGPNPFVVGTLMAVGSAGATLWNVAAVSQRQKLTPPEMQGRSSAAGTMLTWGAQPLGALTGGLIAGAFGLAAPWIVAGALRLTASLLSMRALRAWTN